MNIDYILTEDYIILNDKKILLGDKWEEVESKVGEPLFISMETNLDNNCIVSEEDFEMHFNYENLYMWVFKPYDNFLTFKSEKVFLRSIGLPTLLEILFEKNISWNFNQDLTFSDQLSVQLQNKVNFLFGFEEDSTKGRLDKVSRINMDFYKKNGTIAKG